MPISSHFNDSNINIFNDVVTKNKINKHLLDENDRITEEDIRNIRVAIPENDYSREISKEFGHKYLRQD